MQQTAKKAHLKKGGLFCLTLLRQWINFCPTSRGFIEFYLKILRNNLTLRTFCAIYVSQSLNKRTHQKLSSTFSDLLLITKHRKDSN